MRAARLMFGEDQQRVQHQGTSLAFIMTNRLDVDDHLADLHIPPDHPVERSDPRDLLRPARAVPRDMAQRAFFSQTTRLDRPELIHIDDSDTQFQDI